MVFLFPSVAGVYGGAGLLAWDRRPSNRLGALLCASALVVLAAGLENCATLPALAAAGLIVAAAPIASVFHVLLVFPSGRVGDRPARALVALGYVVTIVLQAPRYLFSHNPGPYNVFEIAHRHGLVHAGILVQNICGGIVLGAGALLLALRLRGATGVQRRVLAPLYLYGIFSILFLETAANVLPTLFGTTPNTVFGLQMAALAGVPVAFASAVLRGGFARTGEIEELGAWLGAADGARPELQAAVAAALGDPSVLLLFWLGEPGYVDATGAPAELPLAASDRAAVEVELAGERIGAICYDSRLIAEPELVRAAGRVIALALERDRLTAQLLSSRDALRESRARIVKAADRERRRIARDLHDGLQGSLVVLAIGAGRIATDPSAAETPQRAEALRAGILDTSDELRRLVHGVMPALLIERGLCAATEDLVDRLPVPTRLELADLDGTLPEPVQSTGYFVLAEALTNAVKHSRARELVVRLTQDDGSLRIEVADDGVGGASFGSGSGLTGLADRLDVLGGQLRIDSPPGHGTLVIAELPCA
ncbi:MAG: hypothetical protein JOY78_15765 [Pseudonocardia sp.]|nr:hypothetical protein [Pseudonocardia sp.]